MVVLSATTPTSCSSSSSAFKAQALLLPSSQACRRAGCPLPQLASSARQQAPACLRGRKSLSCSASAAVAPAEHEAARPTPPAPLKVIVAGAGISGLSLAVGLLNKGYEVLVLERDLTAIRGEGKYRGPIQVCRCGQTAGGTP